MPDQPALPPNTTFQQDLTTAGHRKVTVIWEYTQAAVALIVVCSTMGAGIYLTVHPGAEQIPTIMAVAFGTVVGFYFSRTNTNGHGIIVDRPHQNYIGR